MEQPSTAAEDAAAHEESARQAARVLQQQYVQAYVQMQQALYAQMEEAARWKARAEEAEKKLSSLLPDMDASCSTCEEMLSRLAQAKSLGDLSDLSRMAFDVRTTLMGVEEKSALALKPSAVLCFPKSA